MLAALRGARWELAAAGLALVPLNWSLAGLSWHRIARRIDPVVRFREAMAVVLAGHAIAIWTPARAGEYVGRAVLHGRNKTWSWAAGVGLETFLRFAPPMAIGGTALFFVNPEPAWIWDLCHALAFVLLAAILTVAFNPGRLRRFLSRRRERPGLDFLGRLTTSDMGIVLGFNATRLLTGSLQLTLFALALRIDAPVALVYASAATALSVKNGVPPVTLGDLGIREGAVVIVFAALGVAAPVALNAALFLYAANVLLGAAVGAFVWAGRRESGRAATDAG